MFKLVVLSVLLALAVARPSGILAPTLYSSAIVGSVPTSISHQSSSVVHSGALLHAAPLVHAAPAYAYAAPAVYASPYAYTAHGIHGAPYLY